MKKNKNKGNLRRGLLDGVVMKGKVLSAIQEELEGAFHEIIMARAERSVWQVIRAMHPELEQELNNEMRLLVHCQKNGLPYPPESDVSIDEPEDPPADPGEAESIESESPDAPEESPPVEPAPEPSSPVHPAIAPLLVKPDTSSTPNG